MSKKQRRGGSSPLVGAAKRSRKRPGRSSRMGAVDAAGPSSKPGKGPVTDNPNPEQMSTAEQREWLEHHDLSQRDDSRIDPIRLHNWLLGADDGDRKAALAIEWRDKDKTEHHLYLAELEGAETVAEFEWRAIIKAAELSRFESRVFLQHFKHGVPVYKLAGVLRCTPSSARRGYASVVRKLRISAHSIVAGGMNMAPAPSSRTLSFSERLTYGGRCRALGRLTEQFLEIMDREQYYGLVSQRVTGDDDQIVLIWATKLGSE